MGSIGGISSLPGRGFAAFGAGRPWVSCCRGASARVSVRYCCLGSARGSGMAAPAFCAGVDSGEQVFFWWVPIEGADTVRRLPGAEAFISGMPERRGRSAPVVRLPSAAVDGAVCPCPAAVSAMVGCTGFAVVAVGEGPSCAFRGRDSFLLSGTKTPLAAVCFRCEPLPNQPFLGWLCCACFAMRPPFSAILPGTRITIPGLPMVISTRMYFRGIVIISFIYRMGSNAVQMASKSWRNS